MKLKTLKTAINLFVHIFFCSIGSLYAQETILLKGKIYNRKDKIGIFNATVSSAKSKKGTNTDEYGNYLLKLDAYTQKGTIISFSSVGYKVVQIPFDGRTTIDVALEEETSNLNEVIVTALGIKRNQRSLGYATTTISSEQVNDARSNNFVQALSGKVAGLNLVSSGSGPVNSTKIILRGENSMDPNKNGALIVVDGVPLANEFVGSGVSSAYGAGSGNDLPVDFGNGIADINPDDIESISVLKGASATALYGNRAGNGAIIITTKSGKIKKGLGVTWNSNVSVNNILKDIDYQYKYGQGVGKTLTPNSELYYSYGNSEDGAGTSGTSSAYGPRLDVGKLFYQFDPNNNGASANRVPWVSYKDNRSSFWQNAYTVTNNIAVEGGNDKNSARVSLTHSKNQWIMPNTGYERINASLSFSLKPSAKLRINSKINFTNKFSNNLPATGYNNQSISYFMIFQNPNVNLDWYRNRYKPNLFGIDQTRPFSGFIDNPFVIAYDMTNAVKGYKTVGNIQANYEISNKFSLMLRSGMDLNMEERVSQRPFGSANFQYGYVKNQDITSYEMNTDALFTYKDTFGKDRWSITSSLGANVRRSRLLDANATVDGLVTPNVYKLANGRTLPIYRRSLFREQTNSLFGLVTLGYKDLIYMDFTGRNDWSSTLPVANNSFFYPSVSTSIILSDLLKLPKAISYAKLRLSVAGAGNGTSPYRDRKYYTVSSFPSSATVPTTIPNQNLLPENTTSYELGLDYAMFKNKLRMDFNVYQNFTKNQIINVPIDYATGFSGAYINSGEVMNKGIEISLSGTPIKRNKFSWNTTLNWAANRNKVLALAAGFTDQQIIGTAGNASYIAKVGGSTGDMYGFDFVRNAAGQIVYDNNGLPQRPNSISKIGNAFAKWRGGWNNEFSYKQFRFSILLDGQWGGMVYSQTHHKLAEQGKLTSTLKGREEGFIIGEGVVMQKDGTYVQNTEKVPVGTYYAEYYRRANVFSNSFDASFLKLRELRFEYSFPKKWTQRVAVENAILAIYGRDLAMITKFPIYDPEAAALNGGTLRPGAEIGQMPALRTFGLNLTVKF